MSKSAENNNYIYCYQNYRGSKLKDNSMGQKLKDNSMGQKF